MLTGLAALSLGEALPPFTSNVADHLRLSSSKGAYDGIWSYRVVWSGGASRLVVWAAGVKPPRVWAAGAPQYGSTAQRGAGTHG